MFDQPFAHGHSLLHRLDPRVRLAVAAGSAICLALVQTRPAALYGLAVGAALLLLSRPPLAAVLRRLLAHGVSTFRKLFRGNRSRSEIVATFLAILELCRLRSVTLESGASEEEVSVRFIKLPEGSREGEDEHGAE